MAPQVFGTQSLIPLSHHALFLLCTILIFQSSNTIIFSSAQATNKTEDDRQALLCFKSGISKDPAGVLRSWRSDNFCGWRGVTCSTTLPIRAVSLQLRSTLLTGTLSSCMAALDSLVQLNLGNNKLSGSVPEEIGELRSLQTLMLAGNRLSGTIPLSLGTAASLRYVNLANNSLSGAIPVSLANSSSLSEIILSRNDLSGLIPANLFNSSKLVAVDLRSNALSGPIPHFQKMDALQFLNLTGNLLSGTIPASLGNVSSLRSLLLAQNNLAESIPETLGQIPNLTMLDLSYNRFSGYVPATLYNMSSLALFRLDSNYFIGQIPSKIGHSLPNLQTLVMGGNGFRGPIPDSLTNMSKLQVLDLSSNLLTGVVPSLGSLANLSVLLLGDNKLEADNWAFLTSLTNCTQLLILSVDGNILNGSLPKAVGKLSTKLQRLSFGRNQISGNIPAEIGKLVSLALLDMGQNMLSGQIPPSVGNLSNLFILELSRNRLSGQIPSTVGYLPQLGQFYLDDNSLSGNIPATIGQCKSLDMLNFNNLDGSIPRELLNISSLSLGLDLSNNNLDGPVPREVGNLINLGLLNVSNNKLSGSLPSELGMCIRLTSLQIESNMLSGIIPQSLAALRGLDQIDLSDNNLTGEVPQFFEGFSSISYIDISNNKFEGPIPTGGIFRNSTKVSLQGNKGLCETAAAIFGLPICPTTSPTTSSTKRKINTRLLLIIAPAVTIALFSLLCVVVTVMKGTKAQPSESFKETMKRVSYGDILKATNWFSPVNRISSSHTASVYIGRFEFETDLVAIKVFHLSEQGSRNSFFSECEVLKHTRHRNLVQAITLCSTVDFEGDEFKAIVYEFMANGSLDMWIHPRVGSSRRLLSLGQRISIAADVASALDYMHDQLTPPLIHCDLKPSNVLLDYDMTSRIGDFGSAKFLCSSIGRPEGLIGVGGTIGYIAPEYGMGCKVSTGGDVYGFGVLLLEMLTAMRPTDAQCSNALSLHKYVDRAFPERIAEILDPHMPSEEDEAAASLRMQNYIIPLVSIGLMCTMDSPQDRPGMHDVCARIVAIKEAFVETLL
ncbi:hypothetical protein CFC21_027656 [Triticum aestivum]|uniref:Receptor kinase-like protein Xa21 n=2 Tax=Triticum aestivum TaxID=4565 RepID=A0A9R1EN10_WHEAT|nr:probable LRR receptor-like serine/threonine-protein kinase At3g47570 [Triticum aestivum]KAF7013587.1 hypothetical protein CFC21_027656 [Triticum aestivum]